MVGISLVAKRLVASHGLISHGVGLFVNSRISLVYPLFGAVSSDSITWLLLTGVNETQRFGG
jgi:hypothetical protein